MVKSWLCLHWLRTGTSSRISLFVSMGLSECLKKSTELLVDWQRDLTFVLICTSSSRLLINEFIWFNEASDEYSPRLAQFCVSVLRSATNWVTSERRFLEVTNNSRYLDLRRSTSTELMKSSSNGVHIFNKRQKEPPTQKCTTKSTFMTQFYSKKILISLISNSQALTTARIRSLRNHRSLYTIYHGIITFEPVRYLLRYDQPARGF